VTAVYTRAPRPGGRRGLELVPSPVHMARRVMAVEVITPRTLRSEDAVAELRDFKPDVVIVAAYGLILPKAILDMSRQRLSSDLHASLLPAMARRGAIQRPSWRATLRPASW